VASTRVRGYVSADRGLWRTLFTSPTTHGRRRAAPTTIGIALDFNLRSIDLMFIMSHHLQSGL